MYKIWKKIDDFIKINFGCAEADRVCQLRHFALPDMKSREENIDVEKK